MSSSHLRCRSYPSCFWSLKCLTSPFPFEATALGSANFVFLIQSLFPNFTHLIGNLGQFAVAKTFCSTHSIQFAVGDFMCIRYSASPSRETSIGDQVTCCDPGQVAQDTEDPQVTVRVLHCRVTDVSGLGNNR